MDDKILIRKTMETELTYVRKTEKDPTNSPFILQWSLQEHKKALTDNPNILHLLVVERSSNKPVGYVLINGLEDENDSLEIKRIAFSEKGKGYGRKMLQLIKKWAFTEKKANRLWLEVVDHNERAKSLYESEGFKVEGLQREAIKINNNYQSIYMMSLLSREYHCSD
ncbi:MAG: GNAT family N-acetyltransferase [Niallia sp.]